MFFKDSCAHGHIGNSRGVVQGVVWQAGDQSKALNHVGDGAQIVVFCECRVAADAVQYGQLFAAAFSGRIDGFLNFLGIGHACWDDHGLADTGDVFDQRWVNCSKGRDFVGRGVQVLQQVNSVVVKGRVEGSYT